MFKSTLLSLALLFSFVRLSFAQQAPQQRPPNAPPAAQSAPTPAPTPVPDEPPVVTKHEIKLDERTIKYTVTTGMMPIKNQVSGETEARMFFMAYRLDGVSDPSKRPLMFSFFSGRRELRYDASVGAVRVARRSRRRLQRRSAGLDDHEFPDRALRCGKRSAADPDPAFVHGDRLAPQEITRRFAAPAAAQSPG